MSETSTSGHHLDLDALADAAAADDVPDDTAAHLADCAQCRTALEEVRVTSARISTDLAALPAPTLPDDVAARLGDALRDAAGVPASSASVTTLPTAARWSAQRWLPAAAAVALLLAGAGYGISRLSGGGGNGTATSSAAKAPAASEANIVRNSSGADYRDRASLTAALPQLLAGTATAQSDALAAAPGAAAPLSAAAPTGSAAPTNGTGGGATTRMAADPLARLRDNAGLADCLLALLPPDDPSVRPLALDYASYRGTPALVVVLPSQLPRKLDVYVVGAGCSRANDSTLFYASVDKP